MLLHKMAVSVNSSEVRYFSIPCLNSSDPEILQHAGVVSSYLYILLCCVWSPIISLIGIVGNAFSIVVLKKQFAKEEMYYLQLIIMIVEILASLGFFMNGILFPFLFYATPGPNWVKYSFTLSKYVCVQIILNNMLFTSLILLIAATNVDRLQAITAPKVYIAVNQKKRAALISVLCFVAGILTSCHDVNQTIVVNCSKTNSYEIAMPVTIGTVQIVMEYVRMIVRSIALISLAVFTLLVGIKYRQAEKKRKLLINSESGVSNADQLVKSVRLLTLQIIQSVTLFITHFLVLYFYLNVYILSPAGVDTLGKSAFLYTLIANAVARLGPGVNFIFYIVLSKRFRRAAKQLFSVEITKVSQINLGSLNLTSRM